MTMSAYRVGSDLAILGAIVHIVVARPGDVDDTVNNSMRYMDSLGSELARQGLAEGSSSKHASCHRGEQIGTPDRRSGARDKQGGRVFRLWHRF